MSHKDFFRSHRAWEQVLIRWANYLAQRHPSLYLGSALLLMLPGFGFLFLFPYLVLTGASVLIHELPNVKTMEHWLTVEIWFGILLFCLFFSYHIMRLQFPRVAGLKLSQELMPDLYALVAKLQKLTGQLSVHDIVLTDQYELRIHEAPRFGYPIMMNKTLVVGMPLLQTLSETHFRDVLLHRFGRYTGGSFRPVHWLSRSGQWWCAYQHALEGRRRFWLLPLRWFFSLYAPVYAAFSVPAMRMDELAADSTVLEWINDRDYFDTLKSYSIAEVFLEYYFWRSIYVSTIRRAEPDKVKPQPSERLEHISGHLMSKAFRRKCLEKAVNEVDGLSLNMPSLAMRMENIGQSKLRDTPLVEETAAAVYLGETRSHLVSLMDKLWLTTTYAQWRSDYDKRLTDIKTVKVLSQQSRLRVLNIEEMCRYARLAQQLRGDPWRHSLWKLFKRNVDRLWPDVLRRHHV